MKHAGPETLTELETLVATLRLLPGLVERRPGVFYRSAKAFLHFHDDPAGIFADVRLDGAAFERFRVSSIQERAQFLDEVRRALKT